MNDCPACQEKDRLLEKIYKSANHQTMICYPSLAAIFSELAEAAKEALEEGADR